MCMENGLFTLGNGLFALENGVISVEGAELNQTMTLTKMLELFKVAIPEEDDPPILEELEFKVDEERPKKREGISFEKYAEEIKGGNWFLKLNNGRASGDVVHVYRKGDEIFKLYPRFEVKDKPVPEWEIQSMYAEDDEIAAVISQLRKAGLYQKGGVRIEHS